jgi:uncharacterized protein (TIGR02246 family)
MKRNLAMRQMIVGSALLAGLVVLLQCGAVRPGAAGDSIVGTWRLVSATAKDAAGHVTADPILGQRPLGYLTYEARGHMCGQLVNLDRAKFANETNPTPDEALKAFNGYDAWCANYRLDRQEGAIIYRAEMDLDPNEGSDEVRRYFKFSPDGRLVITFNDSTSKSQTYAFTRIYERVATDSDQRQTGTHEAEVEALRVVEIAEEHAWVLKDFEKAVASYADDAVVMNPNAPAQTGKEQIRAGMKPLFDDPGFTTKYEITGVELAQSGELGYTRGTYSGTSTDPVTKKIVSERGKWLTIRRKQADGAWKIIVDTASSDLPLPAPAK